MFFGRPALTVRSPHRPQPITPREMTRAVAPITTRRRATMCAARVRDTDFFRDTDLGSPRRPRPTTTTRPPMIARTATTTQRTHTALTTPTVTPSAQNQILSRRVPATAESRPPRHRRDASSMAWRRGLSPLDSACATAFSPRKDVVKNYRARPTHRFARRLCGGRLLRSDLLLRRLLFRER